MTYLNYAYRNVGAVVGYPLIIRQDICEHEAELDGAAAAGESGNMPVLYLGKEIVNDLLERLDPERSLGVVVAERRYRDIEYLAYRLCGGHQFVLCFV